MAGDAPYWRLRSLLSALLLVLLLPRPASSALSNNSVEVDLITPVDGGRYRVNPDRGLGVVVAVQNKEAADPHGWSFSWIVRSTTIQPNGVWTFRSSGSIGSESYEPVYAIQDGDPFIALSHPYLYSGSNLPDAPMPPGDYVFSWKFDIGPWCESSSDGSSTYSMGWTISRGNFSISVAEDAPWPAFTQTSCASPAGQVSYSAGTSTWSPLFSFDTPPATSLPCVVTQPVTDSPDPCRATIDAAQAASISNIMTWPGSPTTSGTPTPSVTEMSVAAGVTSAAAATGTPRLNSATDIRLGIYASFVSCISIVWALGI